jgi:hypothetical protein
MRVFEGPQSTMPISSETRVHVVFDRTTGDVLHVHETVVFPNTPQGRETPEARALRLAGASETENLEVVEVDPAEVWGPHRIRIDPVTHKVHRMPNDPMHRRSYQAGNRMTGPHVQHWCG